MFFIGQPTLLYNALGPQRATYHLFENADEAGEYCDIGAIVYTNYVIWDWFQESLEKQKSAGSSLSH